VAKKSNTLTGVPGEYYVCAELGKRGNLALLTPKNNPLFDIVAVAPDASRTVSIQVKSMGLNNEQGWKLNKQITKKKNNPNLFLILFNLKQEGVCDYYIYHYDEIVDRMNEIYNLYINQEKRDGGKRKEVGFRWFDFINFTVDDQARKNILDILGFNN
jgi:hypothetical protein